MEDTFQYFFTKFFNELIINEIGLTKSTFIQRIKNNSNLLFIRFSSIFPKFDLNYKNYSFFHSYNTLDKSEITNRNVNFNNNNNFECFFT